MDAFSNSKKQLESKVSYKGKDSKKSHLAPTMVAPGYAHIKIGVYRKHLDHYLDTLLVQLSHQPSGIMSIRYDLKIFLDFLEGNKIRRINMDKVLEFIPYLRDVRDNCDDSVNRKLSSVKTYLRYLGCKSVRGTAVLPLDHMPRVITPYSGPLKALRPSEVLCIFEQIDRTTVLGVRDYLFFSLLYRLGLRIGEATAINCCDVDLEKNTLLVHGKGRRERTLPLIGNLPALFQEWFLHRQYVKNSEFLEALFVSKKGNRLSQRTAQEKFKEIQVAAGVLSLKKVTPHSLRHAFATHWMESSLDIIVLQAMMGHAKRESTERYVHPSIETQRASAQEHLGNDLLENFIRQGKQIPFQSKNHHRHQQNKLDQKDQVC
jgi:site-specific recombinase XerD